ncbi:MAG: hypothetical protein ABW153_05495 [Sedimenticola sp.]
MSDERDHKTHVSDRALEMIMRDVMDGLVEISLESAFSDRVCDFEIMSNRMSGQPRRKPPLPDKRTDAEVIDFPRLKRASG